MIKICCDKCGREIKDRYYTVLIGEHDTNPQNDYFNIASTACSTSSSRTREDILKVLNSTKMYCKDCRDNIVAFIEK